MVAIPIKRLPPRLHVIGMGGTHVKIGTDGSPMFDMTIRELIEICDTREMCLTRMGPPRYQGRPT